uniref:Uncharacterized protein n=1 Tax=Nelumbo nucifera TaxID=4432 RepID=A0A822XMC0_NELNU|nr:TPA_asm: hypothetical protein HUJ06_022890 [Nelumbo nucifera]
MNLWNKTRPANGSDQIRCKISQSLNSKDLIHLFML